jgi:hypothetical protein
LATYSLRLTVILVTFICLGSLAKLSLFNCYSRILADKRQKVKFRHAQNGHFDCDLHHMGPEENLGAKNSLCYE